MKRVTQPAPAALTEGRFALLALGPADPVIDATTRNDDDLFFAFFDDEVLRRLWTLHRAEVLAEAARRGIPRPLWAERELGDGGDAA